MYMFYEAESRVKLVLILASLSKLSISPRGNIGGYSLSVV
jgi:hypothetical protein